MRKTKRQKIKESTAKECRELARLTIEVCGKLDHIIVIYKNKRRLEYKLAQKYKMLARSMEAKKEHKHVVRTILRDIEELKSDIKRIII